MLDKYRSCSKTLMATLFALLAFAANSVLCRLALIDKSIDPISFTGIRLMSGALVLGLLLKVVVSAENRIGRKSWSAAFMLFIYAACFSFAYISLDTATGALILFGAVQFSMILTSLFRGDSLSRSEFIGAVIAFGGFVYLLLPNVSTPSAGGAMLMGMAGVAWSVYSLLGKGSIAPLADTAINFFRTWPFVLLLSLFLFQGGNVSGKGVVLAVLSGALASGVGYAIWYSALAGLTAVQAAVVQLLVPVLAAWGGVMLASEVLSLHLLLSMLIILGGIALVVIGRSVHKERR